MISIALATYNGIKFIKEQLDSICNQTLIPDEIVVQDDLSTDGTYEFIIEYSKKYNQIKWKIKQNEINLGYKKNFYEAICSCKGDYVFLCDQDDIWLNDKIEKMMNAFKKNDNILLLMSNLQSFYEEGCNNRVHEEFGGFGRIKHFKNLNHCVNTPRPGCTFCIKRELINKYKEKINFEIPHDNLIWQLASIKKKAYLLNTKTMLYRRHANNASNNKKNTKEKRLDAIKIQIRDIEYMMSFSNIDNIEYNFLCNQKQVFEKRYNNLKENKVLKALGLIRDIRYYYDFRLYLVDLYYILKYKGN